MLDFSRVKRYRLGFDTSLIALKSPVALRRFRRVCFDVDAMSFMGKHQFHGFYFNLGVYNSASNYNSTLWSGVYTQLLRLSAALHTKRWVDNRETLGHVKANSCLP